LRAVELIVSPCARGEKLAPEEDHHPTRPDDVRGHASLITEARGLPCPESALCKKNIDPTLAVLPERRLLARFGPHLPGPPLPGGEEGEQQDGYDSGLILFPSLPLSL